MKKLYTWFLLSLFLIFSNAGWVMAAPLTIEPGASTVDVGFNFNGTTLKITGQTLEGSDLYLKVVAPDRKIGLSKKGKKAFFWLTVETVTVSGVPGMFQVLSSAPLSRLTPELQKQMGIEPGYESLRLLAKVTEKHEEKTVELKGKEAVEFINGLVRIYERKGLYSSKEGTIKKEGTNYSATLTIPPDVPKGDIRVVGYAVKDGVIVGITESGIKVQSIGLVKSLGNMAQTNPIVYGILAIAIALSAGIIVAELFKLFNRVVFGEEKGISAHH